MNDQKLLQPITTMPYDCMVGLMYESGNITQDFWYDCDFSDWLDSKRVNIAGDWYDNLKYWFYLGDLEKSYIKGK